jgi:hypothetical protein
MLAGSIANSKLSNSSITINGNSVSLGGSVTVTAQAANALTIGNGLSGTSYNGSGAVTIAIDTATTVDKNSLQTLTNKSVQDGSFFIIDDADATKKVAFSVGGLTTGTTRTLTVGDVSGTIVTTGDTGSVTNTMLAGSIANAKLTNSSVTVGTTAISLGASSTTLAGLTSVTSTSFVGALTGNASTATTLQTARAINGVNFDGSAAITVKASTTNALTIGTGLSGTSFDGGSAVTIAIDSTVATLTGSQTLTNKTLTSPAITTPTVTGATVMKTGSTSVADEYVVYLNASATTANQVLDSLATASYTSARYLIEAVTASDTEMVEVVVTFAGENVYLNSTSLISSASAFQAVYDADISGGNLRLLVTPTNANTKFKVRATAFKAI